MEVNKLLTSAVPSDLPHPLDKYAEAIGVENLFRLAELAGGRRIYIPKPGALLKEVRKRRIVEDYGNGGCAMRTLADRYGISENTVHKYIHE